MFVCAARPRDGARAHIAEAARHRAAAAAFTAPVGKRTFAGTTGRGVSFVGFFGFPDYYYRCRVGITNATENRETNYHRRYDGNNWLLLAGTTRFVRVFRKLYFEFAFDRDRRRINDFQSNYYC